MTKLSIEELSKITQEACSQMAMNYLRERDPLLDMLPKRKPPTRLRALANRARRMRDRAALALRVLKGEDICP